MGKAGTSLRSCPLVSVIIPVYSVDPSFFQKCLNSIASQTYDNIEIIVVDDGDEESTFKKIKSICQGYSNISLIKKSNGGVSSARNEALAKCKGAYIVFLDSDDYFFSNEAIARSMSVVTSYDADIVIGQVALDYGIEAIKEEKYDFIGGIKLLTEKEELEVLSHYFLSYSLPKDAPYLKGLRRGIASRIFKKECIMDLFFNTNLIYGEDSFFDYEAVKKASRVVLVNETWYVYRQHSSSAIHHVELKEAIVHYNELIDAIPPEELVFLYERVKNLLIHASTQQARKKGFKKKVVAALMNENIVHSLKNRKSMLFDEPLWKSVLCICLKRKKAFLYCLLVRSACLVSDLRNRHVF